MGFISDQHDAGTTEKVDQRFGHWACVQCHRICTGKLGRLAFHLRRLAGNVAGKLGYAYLRYQNRQPTTRFTLTATVAMLVKWKASLVKNR